MAYVRGVHGLCERRAWLNKGHRQWCNGATMQQTLTMLSSLHRKYGATSLSRSFIFVVLAASMLEITHAQRMCIQWCAFNGC